MNSVNWTDERVERLKKLWAEGLSASQIAAQLGGVSRNAVIGKVHRLSLPGRAKAGGNASATRAQKRPAAPQRPASYTTQPRAAVPSRPVARPVGATLVKEEVEAEVFEAVDYVPAKNVVVPISRKIGLTELTERTCKWPMGDPLKDDFCFCGAEAPDTSPYCKYHARMAYQPVAERRRSAEARG